MQSPLFTLNLQVFFEMLGYPALTLLDHDNGADTTANKQEIQNFAKENGIREIRQSEGPSRLDNLEAST